MPNQEITQVLIVVLILLSACTHQPADRKTAAASGAASSDADFNGPYIDAHAHFDGDETGPTPKMVDEFRKNNIAGAVVHASMRKGVPDIQTGSAPKFAVCAAIVPGKRLADVKRGIEEKRYHCLKVYLGYVPKAASDHFYRPFYQLAEKKGIPVVFHTGDTYDKKALVKYADPLSVDEIAVAYPKVKFVIAHMGNPWIQSAAEVVYKNDNVSVDLSALMLGDIKAASPEAIQELVVKPIRWFFLYVENPKKLLFGTDWPLLEIAPYLEAVKRAIPKEHWKAVFYSNATELFPSLR